MFAELDGRLMYDRRAAHDHLRERLNFPEYYGRNLDALYDLLTDCGQLTIVLHHPESMEAALGAYSAMLLETLEQAAASNPYLEFAVQENLTEAPAEE